MPPVLLGELALWQRLSGGRMMAVPPWWGTNREVPKRPGDDTRTRETTLKGNSVPSLPPAVRAGVPWDVSFRLLPSSHLHPLHRHTLWSSLGHALGLTWLSLVTSTGQCVYF